MSAVSSYTPFLIGKFTSGKFQYLQPWQSPTDAFEPLINAYSYRGSIYKRPGSEPLGHTGLLRYTNNEKASVGTGASGLYSGTLSHFPLESGNITVTVLTSGGEETFTDNGSGALSGTLGDTGTINYITGAWTITFAGGRTVGVGVPIIFQYIFTNSQIDEVIATGNGVLTNFTGTFSNIPIVPSSITITTTTLAGAQSATDDGYGNFVGSLVDSTLPNTINYTTGAFVLNTVSPVVNLTSVVATYIKVGNGSPIMGINVWINEANNSDTMTVEDQRRMAVYNPTTRLFNPISTFSQQIWQGNGVTNPMVLTIPFTNIAPYSISVTDGTSTVTDIPGAYPNGTFTAAGNITGGLINYATGAITINFAVAPASTVFISISASLQGDYFSGGNTNFFNFTNWKPNDTLPGLLYLTNNVDRITTFDGTNLARPAFPIRGQDIVPNVNGILTCSDIKVYKNRLLVFRPTVNTFSTPPTAIEAQTIRYSSEFYTFGLNTIIPFDFVADVAGHGGTSEAPTADWIIAAEFLRDAIVVFLQKSTWLFRFTGNVTFPFVWQQINSSRTSNAVYGSLAYDNNATSMGTKGLISCDGTNVDRYDIAVIDQFTDIDNDNFIQCVARRDDIRNQSWMIYPSIERPASNNFSDKVIIYNFLENSFATYAINLSCVGLASTFEDITWASFAIGSGSWVSGKTWSQCNFAWNNALSQNLAPEIYGGDQNGYVYTLNVTEDDFNTHIDSSLTSIRWNPFIQNGLRCRFGYIDIYYEVNPDVTLQVEIFVNNSTNPTITKQIVLDSPLSGGPNGTMPVSDDYAWKRLQVNMQGEFIRMNITTPILNQGLPNQDKNDGSFVISGIILWAAPAGRLVPGGFA